MFVIKSFKNLLKISRKQPVKELILTDELHRNYIALQNYRNNVTIKRKRNSLSGEKHRALKVKALDAQAWRCKDCFRPFQQISEATVDHVIPFRYGSTRKMNSEYVCQSCNQGREYRREEVLLSYFGSFEKSS